MTFKVSHYLIPIYKLICVLCDYLMYMANCRCHSVSTLAPSVILRFRMRIPEEKFLNGTHIDS